MHSARGKERLVQLIGVFKLLKTFFLLCLAIGAFRLFHKDLGTFLISLADSLGVDPGSRHFQALFGKIQSLAPKLPLIAAGTLCYAIVFGVEGTGLLLGKRWAEYLTVIVTGSFLPLEGYHMARHPTVIKGCVIALNLAIVIYLIARLKSRRQERS